MLGQFKRGKSTLLNALLGAPVLPTGVTPVTAIPTFIKAGPKAAARITFQDGKKPLLTSVDGEIPDVLERYISEVKNSHNRFNVENVEIEVRSEFLNHGIVLIDTPGVGSTFLHNTRAAEAVLTECDAAVFCVSSDPPITEVELNYLSKVQELIPKIFFALNKVDLLDIQERRMAERFLADVLNRARLQKELNAETDQLWKKAQSGLHQILTRIAGPGFDEAEARNQIAAELSRYFEKAFREFVEMFRTKLSERLAVHQGRAGALIKLVRQTAADLMEIAVVLPQSNEAFEVKREPYWVAPETVASLFDLSASVITRFLPSGVRENRARRQLVADADKAVLRNIANLDWAMRQNIEEGFRRFESSLSERLGSALQATRQAMHIAIERRTARIEEIDEYSKELTRSIASLSNIFTELQAIGADPIRLQ